MPEGDLPTPEGAVDSIGESMRAAMQRMEDAIRIQGETAANILSHVTNSVTALAELKALHAAQEVPAAASDVVHAEGAAAGQLLEGAADVGAAPAEVFVTRRRGLRRVREKA